MTLEDMKLNDFIEWASQFEGFSFKRYPNGKIIPFIEEFVADEVVG